ncbi:MAG: response regulator transcription factor [Phenylobacterium sp.]|uniref:response regulator transcription factor n=1 Tax=Phenylobacterium sp. TaxID=1871053 RepID=UPI001A4A7DEB|nr:response regulator transcription factor [Phenylobacterium sp.]MBL8552780.1 response regulator transcription factor [Phenylobacterium sp.]
MPLGEGRRRRVLVADDEPYILELIVTRLELAGFDVRPSRNGQDALERLADFKPEAMVLDINMPVLDGFGVLARMKAQGLSDKVPTMVLTARNSGDDVARAIRLGARDYLAKPFKDEALIARVGRLLARPRPVARV